MKTSRLIAIVATLLATIAASLAPAHAQVETYPHRVVTIVVPFPAGSATDIVARKVAEGFRQAFGQPFIVENKAGADGVIAARHVLAAPADGYTLFMTTNTTQSANPNIYKQLPYDPQKDFSAIGGVLKISYLMAVRLDLPADDLASFTKLAKSAKPSLSFGSGNTGSRAAGELLKARLGIDLQHVPYRGSPQALNDLLGGQIDVFFADPASAMALLGQKKFKIFGSTGSSRIKTLPDVPTLTELGIPDYNIVAWVGLFTSAGVPKPVVAKLNAALKTILDEPETQAFLAKLGADPFPASSEELAAFVVEDTKRWKEIVDIAKIEQK